MKALLNAPTLREAKKLESKMPKKVPRFAAYQVRSYWGLRSGRVEHCFVCNKPLYFEEEYDKGDSTMLDSPAVYFRTGGNWPSTVLDMEKNKIEILVCDDCVKERKDRMFIIEEKPPNVRKTYHRKSFKQYRDEEIARIKRLPKKRRPKAFRIT
jgi:hypothetical protein